jgi:hypothetical protein
MRVKKPLIISIRNLVSAQTRPRIRSCGSFLFSTAPSLTTAEELPNGGLKADEILNEPSKDVHLSSEQSNEIKASTEPKYKKNAPYPKHERQNGSHASTNPNSTNFQHKKYPKLNETNDADREIFIAAARLEIKNSFQAGNPVRILSSYKKIR